MYTLDQNKSFGQLLKISSTNFTFYRTFNTEFSYIEIWFTDKNSKQLEIKNKINISLVVLIIKLKFNQCVTYKIRYSFEPGNRIFVKANGFLCFAKNIGKT